MLKLVRLNGLFKRHISVYCGVNCNRVDVAAKDDYTPIYKFPYIRALNIINRLKIYQIAATAIAIPTSYVLKEMHYVTDEVTFICAMLGCTGIIALCSINFITNKFIGFVYLNQAGNKVKVAYIDFWGRRKDVEIPTGDIVPFSDQPIYATNKLYMRLKRFSSKDVMKMNLEMGIVLDKEKFDKVFK